jgi:hypothetical protein
MSFRATNGSEACPEAGPKGIPETVWIKPPPEGFFTPLHFVPNDIFM